MSDDVYFLRLNIPFDLRREEDLKFLQEMEKLQNGYKVSLVRYLLLQAMADGVKGNLERAIQDNQARGRRRGAPRKTGDAKERRQAKKIVTPVFSEKLEQASKEVAVEKVEDSKINSEVEEGLSKYAGMLGSTSW